MKDHQTSDKNVSFTLTIKVQVCQVHMSGCGPTHEPVVEFFVLDFDANYVS